MSHLERRSVLRDEELEKLGGYLLKETFDYALATNVRSATFSAIPNLNEQFGRRHVTHNGYKVSERRSPIMLNTYKKYIFGPSEQYEILVPPGYR